MSKDTAAILELLIESMKDIAHSGDHSYGSVRDVLSRLEAAKNLLQQSKLTEDR